MKEPKDDRQQKSSKRRERKRPSHRPASMYEPLKQQSQARKRCKKPPWTNNYVSYTDRDVDKDKEVVRT